MADKSFAYGNYRSQIKVEDIKTVCWGQGFYRLLLKIEDISVVKNRYQCKRYEKNDEFKLQVDISALIKNNSL